MPHSIAPPPSLAAVLAACLLAACLLSSGCGAANVKAQHTGRFDNGRPVVAMGTCCIGYEPDSEVDAIYANDPKRKTLWLPVVEQSGMPFPAGHHHDAYYTGDTVRPFGSKRPEAYRFKAATSTPTGRFPVNLATLYPKLKTVDFHEFKAYDDGRLTDEGRQEVRAWLRSHYGKDATIKRLGEGGFSIAYRVCTKPRDCVVVKVRKMPPTFAEWKRVRHAISAASELKRDLAIAEVAKRATSWATYVGKDGKDVPMTVAGKPLSAPEKPPEGPPGRIARVAGAQNAALLQRGSVEQALIAFWASDSVAKTVKEAHAAGSTWRTQAQQEAAGNADIKASAVKGFFDSYDKTSRVGPEVIKVHAFVSHCAKLAAIPTIKRYCEEVRLAFQIPDDFDDRVAALEWMYRDTAADVIRFTRANFGRALGNPAQDGEFREIGLDYNHGRNAGWDPQTRQFVLFDF